MTAALGAIFSVAFTSGIISKSISIISPVANKNTTAIKKHEYEVFGFAPYWTINKLDNVDFNTLTTLAYFGVPVNPDGTFDEDNVGFKTLQSDVAKKVFNRAHNYGARVVLTLTQMDSDSIEALMDDKNAQDKAIENTVNLVAKNNLDGVNIDFEYVGDPGPAYRNKFTDFVANMTKRVHSAIPDSRVTVSVYAASVRDPKIYDIASVSKVSDQIFMMAYDFATSASSQVIPTAPLYGYKEGKYWYDVSTAVEDFLKLMPAQKLILGMPWYGYNYPVSKPAVKAAKYQGYSYYYWYRGRRYIGYSAAPASSAITYSTATTEVASEKTGWDDTGKVGWIAWQADGVWRMAFLDDAKSLKIKYEFAKDKSLGGVGIWALGFDSGTNDMWSLLSAEFGQNLAYNN